MAKKRASRRRSTRRSTRRSAPTPRRASRRSVSRASTRSKGKNNDLAAMYLSILIVGIAGIILLFANPTEMMRRVIGILLVILGLWGLMAKKK